MDLELRGRTAIVTGGSSGIGKAVARELAMEGVDVAIAARRPEPLEMAAQELAQASGRRIVPIPADTSDDDSVRAWCNRQRKLSAALTSWSTARRRPEAHRRPSRLRK